MSRADATGLSALPPFQDDPAGRQAWARVSAYVDARPFLRSEGVGSKLGAPRRAEPWLVDASRELVRRFDHFYRLVLDAESSLNEPAVKLGAPYEAIAAREGGRPPLPLSRFDCVLEADGRLRVIELNPVGVCTLHLRSAAYLAYALQHLSARGRDDAYAAAARAVDTLRVLKTDAITRFVRDTVDASQRRIGIPLLPGMHRGSLRFWQHELESAGFRVVVGRPEAVQIDRGIATLGSDPVDALWIDWVAYLGFQQRRYEQTRFATKAGNFSSASAQTERLLTLPGLDALLAERRLTLLSPIRGYRAISKALLAWIDRPELPLSAEERTYLREHVAETFDHHARRARMRPEQARVERETLVLKPCRFGGSHGVVLGRELGADDWARRLDEIWEDPEWVLQRFSAPVTDEAGAHLSYGAYNYAGELGGLLVRSAPERVVSARTADAIVAVF